MYAIFPSIYELKITIVLPVPLNLTLKKNHISFPSPYSLYYTDPYTRSGVLILIAVWWSTYHGVKTFPFGNNLKYLYLFPITQNGAVLSPWDI